VSYARFGWDNSDVYVFLSVGGHLECCGCVLAEYRTSPRFTTTAEMIQHLDKHRETGHTVPDDCYERLLAEAEANDEWIRTGDDKVLDG
jgi:hypothetical protein